MDTVHIDRRSFLTAAALGAGMAATANTKEEAMTDAAANTANPGDRPVKYWMHGFGGDDARETARALREAGFSIVVAGGSAVIEAVNEAGMASWLCGGGYPLVRDEDALKSRDIEGNAQVWFGSGSPCCPEIQDASLAAYEQMVKTDGISGILVDGVRFASPASGLMPFLTDFSAYAENRAGELGFDFSLMKSDVARLHQSVMQLKERPALFTERFASPSGMIEWLTGYPGVFEWLRFRRAHTTGHFRALSEIIHGAGLRMGVYIFTPCLAPLVGQSYEDLRDMVDVFAPMIYRNYPKHPGPACLNWELAELPHELGFAGAPAEAETMSAVLAWAGFADLGVTPRVEAVREALPPETVGRETGRARGLIGGDKELAPIIYIDDPLMGDTARLVRANNADGINFFVFKEDWKSMVAPATG